MPTKRIIDLLDTQAGFQYRTSLRQSGDLTDIGCWDYDRFIIEMDTRVFSFTTRAGTSCKCC